MQKNKKHISYPKIGQFRDVIRAIRLKSRYVGNDENGEPMYDNSLPIPTVKFQGTVKLHGTNASVSCNNDHFWIQSRKNIISTQNDNAAFAFFINSRLMVINGLINKIVDCENIDTSIYTVTLYGEWAGKGIQRGVAINKIDKSWFLFGAKVSKIGDDEFNSYWVPINGIKNTEARIYNIFDFKKYEIDINFEQPELAQNKLEEITMSVEKHCPVAEAFDYDGFGEGVVWVGEYKNDMYRFKVKGEKHSVTKVKTLAPVDVEKLNSINEFVDYVVTQNRFEQAVTETIEDGLLDIKKMGDVIRWVINDIISEEISTLSENNLEPKDVNKNISNKVRQMFFEAMNKEEM